MLARRKEEFALYEEKPIVREANVKVQPVVNKKLRRQCLIFILVFAALSMLTTLRSETIVTDGYALVQAKVQAEQLEKENERLNLEIAQMKSPQRIQEIAVNDLGMVAPKEVYFATQRGQ